MQTKTSRLFIILCNHRSGSSATAGVLHHLGVHMGGSTFGPDVSNPKGHFENIDFVMLNDKILSSVDSNWTSPPSRTKILSSNFPQEQIRSFIENQIKPVWGLKDPRATLTFDIWKPHFEVINNITFIFVWRPIEESIHSLSLRDGYDLDTANAILAPYKANLEQFRYELDLEKKDIIDIHFSRLLKNPEDFVKEINKRIKQKDDHNIDNVREFLDRNLKHH